MKIYIHPPTGDLVIAFHVAFVSDPDLTLVYDYLGIAVENCEGITCLWDISYLDFFEYIGEL